MISSTLPRTLIAGPRGSGKTSRLIAHVRELLNGGVPARRILVVTFSPRVAARIAAHLPAEVDAEHTGGLWLQTAQHLCARLLRECYRSMGEAGVPRIISAVERATILHAAVAQARRELGDDHPLAPALGDVGGLAEVGLLIEAIAGQGGTPPDLQEMGNSLPATGGLDRAVLDGIVRVYDIYRCLSEQVGGLTYQEIAARAAGLLADPALAAPIAARIDHLLIDDLDRAEPMQVEVLARISTRAHLMATVDPAALISDRARRVASLTRERLGLGVVGSGQWAVSSGRENSDLTRQPSLHLRGEGEHNAAVSPLPVHGRGAGGEGRVSSAHCPLPTAYWTVAQEQIDGAEAAYVARAARAAVAEAAEAAPDGEPDVLIVVPASTLCAPLLAALRAEDVEVVDVTGGESIYDSAVRYVLAWLRALAGRSDEHWGRLLASPHARIAAADVARLCRWAGQKELSLEGAVVAAADGGCESLGDAARTRLAALARLLNELRHSIAQSEAPSVTVHRLLAREDLVGALLVGPTDAGAAPPDPRGLGGLCELVSRLEALWPHAYGRQPSLAALLDRLEQGIAHLLERAGAPPAGRVVLAGLDDAIDWRARVVIVPGLAEKFLPRPRSRCPLLSDATLAHLRQRWALPWPADFASYAQGEQRALNLAIASARERVVLTRALRYDGEEAAVPSPLLLDVLGVAEINAETCRAAGARFDRPARHAWPLLALAPHQIARNLDTLLYHHALSLAERRHDPVAADAFMTEARAILAGTAAPVRSRFLTLDDPFAPLPDAVCALPPGARISAHDLTEYLYCPRRFFYGALAGIRAPATMRMSFGALLSRAVQALHRLRPSLDAATDDEALELLRLLWEGEALPDAEPSATVQAPEGRVPEALSTRFGPRLQAEAARARARGLLRRLVAAGDHPAYRRRTRATGVSVELPITLANGRTVRVTGTVDRIAEKPDALALVDYRSGSADLSPGKLIEEFLNREDDPDWRPRDYTLPLLFLSVAGRQDVYAQNNLPRLPVRELAVVSLGRQKDGRPAYYGIAIKERDDGNLDQTDSITVDELRALEQAIAARVAMAATSSSYGSTPAQAFNPCRGCAHRFACPGPEESVAAGRVPQERVPEAAQ